jgi:CubicO group peptidase (beta-lactamase class C family)
MRTIARHTGSLFFYILVSTIVLLNSCSSKTSEQHNDPETAAYDFLQVEKKIQSWVDSGYYTGASILVAKDGQVILEKYFGDYTPETQAYIASAGKWLAAATIATVVDDGKLTWDDKVSQWLPDFTDVKGQATLRQLLSHTSGYPDYQPKGNHPDDYQSLAEAVKHIVDLPADTLPGSAFHYGGLAMQVAGRMAEMATGKDWESLFQEKITAPLEMTNTHFTPVDPTGGHNPMIGGAARSTLHDYAHFLEMILNDGIYKGKRVLSANAIREMQADQIKSAHVSSGEYVENARAVKHTSVYGLGEWRESLDNKGEAILISSPSWAGAYPWIDKENNVYGFFLTHVNVEQANQDEFSSFYASPVLPMMIRAIIVKASGIRH